MEVKIHEINSSGVSKISYDDFQDNKLNEASVYLYEIISDTRSEAVKELKPFQLKKDILQHILEPSKHLRFETLGEITYGELAWFSSNSKQPMKYIGVINYKNILFLIHEENEKVFDTLLDSISKVVNNKIEATYVLYHLILEILSSYSELILDYREIVENFSTGFNKTIPSIDPKEFLKVKLKLSDFATVVEKLHYSLNFPPVENINDKVSPYKSLFTELLKTTDMVKRSLTHTELQFNTLHHHYILLLQEKSNKRINFLTIIQAIFVPLTLIAGIYGMNFSFMPELNLKYGYFIILGLMVVIILGFIKYFYKHGWFE